MVLYLQLGCGQHRTSRLTRSEFSGCRRRAGIKQPKSNQEGQSCVQLNLAKLLFHDWAEAERKFAGESLFLHVPKQMTVQNEGEFLLFLLICAWTLSLQGSDCLAEAGQQSERVIIFKLCILFNKAHSSVIQKTPGFYHMMCRK